MKKKARSCSNAFAARIYAVKNADGYVMFYFVSDKVLLDLFESYNIPIIKIGFEYI